MYFKKELRLFCKQQAGWDDDDDDDDGAQDCHCFFNAVKKRSREFQRQRQRLRRISAEFQNFPDRENLSSDGVSETKRKKQKESLQ
jgi:hypothetical protein